MGELFGFRVPKNREPLAERDAESLLQAMEDGLAAGRCEEYRPAVSEESNHRRVGRGWGIGAVGPSTRFGSLGTGDSAGCLVGSVWTARGGEFTEDRWTVVEEAKDLDAVANELSGWDGKFALARFSEPGRRLQLARDAVGLQPFFFLDDSRLFLFATAIKALLVPEVLRLLSEDGLRVDSEGLAQILGLQLTLGETTLYRFVRRVLPGMVYELKDSSPSPRRQSFRRSVGKFDGSADQASRRLLERIETAVARQSEGVGEIELAALLSGGLDSSTVATLSARFRGSRLRTYTGYYSEGPEFDERSYAHAVATSIGSEHEDILITAADFAGHLKDILEVLDQPMAGPGSVGQLIVAKRVSSKVSKVLTGEGGDELFGGYARVVICDLLSRGLTLDSIGRKISNLGDYRLLLRRLAALPRPISPEAAYARLLMRSGDSRDLYHPDFLASLSAVDVEGQVREALASFDRAISATEAILRFERHFLLPVLLELDHLILSAVGLEGGCPLLDRDVVEFTESLPTEFLLSGSGNKPFFRNAMADVLPASIIARRDKKGFPLPLQQWARGCLREGFGAVLLDRSVKESGMFESERIEEALDSEVPYSRGLWGALSLALWATHVQRLRS